jgi:hypothetical protein
MSRRISRSTLLIILAVANLVFWVLVAAIVGLAVSDEMDLGVETFIREQQATAAVAWKQIGAQTSKENVEPVRAALTPSPGVFEAASTEPTAPTIPLPAVTAQSPPRIQATADPTLPPLPTPLPAQEQVAPQPEETAVRTPLLLSDLDFNSMMHINAEMDRSAVGRAVQIRFSEETLNDEVETLLQNHPELPYRNVHVDLRRDHVLVTGDVTVLGFDVNSDVMGTVIARDCIPQMQIQSISLGGVLTPGLVKEKIKGLLAEAMNWYPADYPLCLEQIVLEEDRATVYGRRR